MSKATEVILIVNEVDGLEISQLNILTPDDNYYFEIIPDHYFTGSKAGLSTVCIGCFNYLDLEALFSYIRLLQFSCPESVQLLYKLEDECKFTMVDIFQEVKDDDFIMIHDEVEND